MCVVPFVGLQEHVEIAYLRVELLHVLVALSPVMGEEKSKERGTKRRRVRRGWGEEKEGEERGGSSMLGVCPDRDKCALYNLLLFSACVCMQ